MAFEGMDVGQVSTIHGQMTRVSSQLQEIIGSMSRLVSELEQAWRGADATEFANHWQTTHQAQLQNALNGLEEMCTRTHLNLQAQQQASAAYQS